jgi:Bacteriophage Mu Gam like protein
MDAFDPEHVRHARLRDARDVLEGRVEENTLVEYMDPAGQYQAHLDQTFQGRESFVVDTDSRADWALRKLAEARRRVRERQAFVEIEVARLLAWQAKLDAEDVRTIHYMEQLLAEYFEQLQSEGRLGRKKSYRLPHGQLAARQVPVQWEVDEAQLLAWAEPLGLVRIEKAPAWKAIKARLIPAAPLPGAAAIDMTTGELVPGVTLKDPAAELFQVRTEDETNHGYDL